MSQAHMFFVFFVPVAASGFQASNLVLRELKIFAARSLLPNVTAHEDSRRSKRRISSPTGRRKLEKV
jgi:hypothetical protein